MSSAGRSHRAYRKNVEILKREAAWVCHRCGEAIDPRYHYLHPQAWTADHIVPLRDCDAMGVDPNGLENLRPAHRSCNSRGGAEMTNAKKAPAQTTPRVSRRWY